MSSITRRQFGKTAAAAWVGTALGNSRVLGQLLEEHHVLEPPRMGSLL